LPSSANVKRQCEASMCSGWAWRLGLVTDVDAATGAGFAYFDLAQLRQGGCKLYPDPARKVFAGGVLKAWYVIEIVVIEALENRPKRRLNISKVHHPARFFANLTLNANPNDERMAVEPRAFVLWGHIRQPVSCFEGEFFKQSHNVGLRNRGIS